MKFRPIPSGLLSLMAAWWCSAAAHSDHVKKQDVLGTATVNLAVPQGTPSHLASGFLYGIPDTPNQVPDQFYTDMGYNYGRAGGSQLPVPYRGWVYGTTEFQNRFDSALSNYKTARSYGARFQLLVADIWGADGTTQIAMPGDDGDWTYYDQFLDALFTQIIDNDMTEGLDFEIWNEPDLSDVFWQRNQTQYLDLWGHAYPKIRAAFPDMPIIGPCSSSAPSTSNSWYTAFYPFVLSNSSVPDFYCWHEEAGGDIATNIENNRAALAYYGLPSNPVIINEYATADEQVPGNSAWYIARLERYNTTGLRGNWASGYSLHDYFANLLGKPDATENCTDNTTCAISTGYWGNGEYNVYTYYNLNMTGERVETVGSADGLFDVYATFDGTGASPIKILGGSRLTASTWDILITNLTAVGLLSSGTLPIQSYQFNFTNGEFGDVPGPINLGTSSYRYYDDQLVFTVGLSETAAYAFEF